MYRSNRVTGGLAMSNGRALRSFMVWIAASLLLAGSGRAQSSGEPTDFESSSTPLVAPTRIAWCAVWSPDETWIAACYGFFQGDMGRICAWDVKTGAVRWQAQGARGIRRVAISPDGALVASGSYGGEIQLGDAATGELRRSLGSAGSSVEGLCFSADGRQLVVGGNRRTVRMLDVTTGQILKTFE